MPKVDWDQTEYDEGRQGFELLAKGRYAARVTGIERKDTKNKSGYYFEVEFTLTGGEANNRKQWANLNVSNPSEVAQRIGREQWNSLCVACGFDIGTVKDTKQLEGKRVVILVDIERRDGYDDRNKVTGFFAPDGNGSAELASRALARNVGSQGTARPAKTGSSAKRDDGIEDDIPF